MGLWATSCWQNTPASRASLYVLRRQTARAQKAARLHQHMGISASSPADTCIRDQGPSPGPGAIVGGGAGDFAGAGRGAGGGGRGGPGVKLSQTWAPRKSNRMPQESEHFFSRQNSRSRSGVFRSKLNLPIPTIGDCNLARSHPLQAAWSHIWVGRGLHDPIFRSVTGCTIGYGCMKATTHGATLTAGTNKGPTTGKSRPRAQLSASYAASPPGPPRSAPTIAREK